MLLLKKIYDTDLDPTSSPLPQSLHLPVLCLEDALQLQYFEVLDGIHFCMLFDFSDICRST